ncbi:Ig-like domain-containing protein [Nocardioides daeguensis]|uniref:Bacterial Ig-like domain-containing protein n=1 Tax=Nocardioides daeguensis TaxID=908359 RepID=A0ABP6VD07_9ACTN|nr:Ig-like domain-containing protein [Nocardioides daeguensis]MBV6726118.1 Ig-like domain-containing protein [Nocardioides daeguensis]MCR1771961.1 Ig-like domain-containing protein [Nocardioides daeguensis]
MTPQNRKRKSLLALGASLLTASLLALASPAQAAGEWQDGSSESDTILDCWTGQPSTGVTANVGWWSPTGEVPKVGEPFLLHGYIGLVGLPCSSGVAVVPEMVFDETAFGYPDEPVKWGINAIDDPTPTFSTDPVELTRGPNNGIAIASVNGQAITLKRGQIFEFQVPVVAKRALKGTATPAPSCYERTAGIAPCPVATSGDHLQVAFQVAGHGGNKTFVTPYVPLFAAGADGGAGGGGGGGQLGKVPSTTGATYKVSARKAGRATVTVRAASAPTGQVVVRDLARNGRVVARGTLTAGHHGVLRLKVAKLGKGKHRLVAEYTGSTGVQPSSAAVQKLRLK